MVNTEPFPGFSKAEVLFDDAQAGNSLVLWTRDADAQCKSRLYPDVEAFVVKTPKRFNAAVSFSLLGNAGGECFVKHLQSQKPPWGNSVDDAFFDTKHTNERSVSH